MEISIGKTKKTENIEDFVQLFKLSTKKSYAFLIPHNMFRTKDIMQFLSKSKFGKDSQAIYHRGEKLIILELA